MEEKPDFLKLIPRPRPSGEAGEAGVHVCEGLGAGCTCLGGRLVPGEGADGAAHAQLLSQCLSRWVTPSLGKTERGVTGR